MAGPIFVMAHAEARRHAVAAVQNAPVGHVVRISEPTRNLEQNALMWPLLGDLAKQIVWHGRRLTDEEWKCVLTASLKRQEVVPGLDGGFVVLGQRTSTMTKRDFSELIELIYAFGAQHDVVWSEPKEKAVA